MFAMRRGSTSETTDWRTAYRLTNAKALATRNVAARTAIPSRNRARQTSLAPSDANQSESVYCSLAHRPSERTSAAATSAPMTTRRFVTSDGHALLPQPPFHLRLDLRETGLRAGFEAGDEDRLGVGRPDESPAVTEEHAHAVDVDDVVSTPEIRHRALDDAELDVVATVHANLRRADELRYVGEKLPDGAPGIGDDSQQPRRAVERIIVPVITVGEEHVAGHLSSQRRAQLLHLVLDEGVARLPHHRRTACASDLVRERLAALHVEDDGDARTTSCEDVARVEDQQVVAPHDLPRPVDHADPVRIAVERDPQLRAFRTNGGDEGLEVLRDGRIGVMVRERAVVLGEKTERIQAQRTEQLRRDARSRSIAAVVDDLERPRESADPGRDVVDVAADDLSVTH